MKSTIHKFQRFVQQHELLKSRDRVVLAVSGGPDSLAMLRLFMICQKQNPINILVAHICHGLRGRASGRDERTVRDLCDRSQIAYHSMRVNVRKFKAIHHLSLEEAARLCRYDALLTLCNRRRFSKLATAHTLEDQAETVLMRLIRGTGLRGMSAIPIKRVERGVTIIRPLLGLHKTECIQFLNNQGIGFCRDLSNADTRFMRNRVRHKLIPLMERSYNPAIKKHLLTIAEHCQSVYDFFSTEAERLYWKVAHQSSKGTLIRIERLKNVHPSIRYELYFKALEHMNGNRRQFSKTHIDAIAKACSLKVGKGIMLPKGILVSRSKTGILLSKSKRSAKSTR